MKQETTKKERDMKKVGLIITATAGTVCTIGLGALCVIQGKKIKNLEINNSIAKEAYEGVAEKLFNQTEAYKELAEKSIQQNETIELVRDVIGGKLIDRLIKNEEKVRSALINKKDRILNNGLDETAKTVIKNLDERIDNSMDTISDFINVKEALKRD